MNITQIKLILKQPIPIILAKVKTVLIEKIEGVYWGRKYSNTEYRNLDGEIEIATKLVGLKKIDKQDLDKNVAEYLTNMYLSHRFDLLGSGWVKNSYHSESVGIEGIKFENRLLSLIIDNQGDWLKEITRENHLKRSKEIWREIVSSNSKYDPIDWQKDYKSGFRFDDQLIYHKQQELVDKEGIDLKVPWELSRFQHLPQMALFAEILPERKVEIITEFRNQVLDFIMTNPPGMGVNWNCTMDVGIRVANLLLAYDWFGQMDEGNVLDNYFKSIFVEYVHSHGKHIINNFEYKEGLTSNHYLGNVAGLTFVSCYLSGNDNFNEWLMLSIQELKSELPKQFFKDGGNFEGSTSYHRLSGEMFAYSTAIVNALPETRIEELNNVTKTRRLKKPVLSKTNKDFKFSDGVFGADYYAVFEKMSEFSMAYRKENGTIVQIGDNDSGRFFRLSPNGEFLNIEKAFEKYSNLKKSIDYKEANYWDENHINHDPFISMLSAFVTKDYLGSNYSNYKVERSFMDQLIFKKTISNNIEFTLTLQQETKLEWNKEKEFLVKNPSNSLLNNIEVSYFLDFGMATFRSDRLFLNVSFGNNRKSHHSWGHHHNDKLSVEINVDGEDLVFDPGTYVYTPLPSKRNLFRSTEYHNTIYTGKEQNTFNNSRRGLFNLNKEIEIEVLSLTNTKIVLNAKYRDVHHIRKVTVLNDRIVINDSCNKEFEQKFNSKVFSNGYGKSVKL
mgnify:CR=1 FL=1|tara:strand:+ start:5120 stop:7300 length:2181 start_codon:yes stop_codon:yes gene_type:complete